MKKTTFDCVEMMHQGAESVRRQIEGMTMEEELAYWRRQTDALRELKREGEEKIRKAS